MFHLHTLFQNKKAEVENGDASFNPIDETVEVKTKPDKSTAKKVQQPKMVKIMTDRVFEPGLVSVYLKTSM